MLWINYSQINCAFLYSFGWYQHGFRYSSLSQQSYVQYTHFHRYNFPFFHLFHRYQCLSLQKWWFKRLWNIKFRTELQNNWRSQSLKLFLYVLHFRNCFSLYLGHYISYQKPSIKKNRNRFNCEVYSGLGVHFNAWKISLKSSQAIILVKSLNFIWNFQKLLIKSWCIVWWKKKKKYLRTSSQL